MYFCRSLVPRPYFVLTTVNCTSGLTGNPLEAQSIEKYARTGWVDLRLGNFEVWRERLARASELRPDIVAQGSAAFDVTKYSGDRFVPGDFVGWLLTTEVDEQGMVGRRLF